LSMWNVPVMRPKLQTDDRVPKYLRRIDESRFYSNFGPLACALEERLAAHYGVAAPCVTTVANATQGLTLALTAQAAKPGTLCAMPAWTFVASAHAAVNAGLIPYFVDVDAETWAVDPEGLAEHLAQAPAPVGAVMPVAPFGQPINPAAWDAFRANTRLPVVIDAAAGFDALVPGAIPAVVSLHATKVLGTGEGGFLVCTDPALVRRVRLASNFGIDPNRQAIVPATNAKMSEYHAAVGHAALDEWGDTRREWMAVASAYRKSVGASNLVRFQEGFGEAWVSSTCVLQMADGAAYRVEKALAGAGIETRRWWSKGTHAHPTMAQFPRTPLPVTNILADTTLAIPFHRDLAIDQIGQISEIMLAVE
jgi:dTDP-4-amino-4,6-dideoxygalactose transaminase